MSAVKPLTATGWQTISRQRVLFGHQSVGNNLLDGVRVLAEEARIKLPITEGKIPLDVGITHFMVGNNRDPFSKIKDFSSSLAAVADQMNADIAFMKFCYIDFDTNTNIKMVAETYINTLDQLNKQFPHTRFIVITTPLRTVQIGPKAWLKRLLGKTPGGDLENARRQDFNDILRRRFQDQGQLFDLARFEAQGQSINVAGKQVDVLDPVLSYDGGHLNTAGQKRIASAFLHFLATMEQKK